MTDYEKFLEKKRHTIGNLGFKANYFPDIGFDFQNYIIEKAILKGRIGVFADTGLGKTLIQLSIAKNIIQHTKKRVLILTPLAVAFQFILEADKLGIDDIEYSKDGKFTKKIVICNYERLHYFDQKDFVGVILDESSILKNFDGKIKNQITAFVKKIPYRFLSTATPSPNDFIELGTSSEALGYMGYMDMLGKFFKNNSNNVDSNNRNIGEKYYLKPHAENDFFAWVNQWSILCKMPSDLGFSNDRYILPPLNINKNVVKNQSMIDVKGQIQMFTPIAKSMTEVKHEQRQTIIQRCEKAAELCEGHDVSFVWCNLNEEGVLLEKIIPNSINVQGSDSIEKKEEAVLWFLGQKCICNSKYFGVNWQKRFLCGSQNTQKIEKKSIKEAIPNDKKGKAREEARLKIRSICKIITKIIKTNSLEMKIKMPNEIESVEKITKTIQNIEIAVNSNQFFTIEEIQLKELNDFLGGMELLIKSMSQYLKNKITDVPFVEQKIQDAKKNLDFILITVIRQKQLEDYCAQTAILDSENLETALSYSKTPKCTCGFLSGKRRMISKPKIFGFGLNFQHCGHSVFFPTWSYEQYYQALRRFWRFGRVGPVDIDLVVSDGQQRVLDTIEQKTRKAIQLHENLTRNVNGVFENKTKEFNKEIIKPNFL